MGKITLYHPIHFAVIRGAAEKCGWRLGRFVQIAVEPDKGFAMYHVQVVNIPKSDRDKSDLFLGYLLNECFAADINVATFWTTKSHHSFAEITCDLLLDIETS